MTRPDVSIRDATSADVPAITAIYAYAVLNTVAALDTDEPTVESQTEWFKHHDTRHPVLVAVRAGEVVGWASLSQWSAKRGYDGTAEASVYTSPAHTNCGIGTALLRTLIERARVIGLHSIIARISSTNVTSLKLTRRSGFSDVGTMKEAGFKFGSYVDVEVLQFILDSAT